MEIKSHVIVDMWISWPEAWNKSQAPRETSQMFLDSVPTLAHGKYQARIDVPLLKRVVTISPIGFPLGIRLRPDEAARVKVADGGEKTGFPEYEEPDS